MSTICHRKTVHGRPTISFAAEAILQAAERLDVDVIAMGSHGRTGVKRTVLGSVAEEVARRSSRPVFVYESNQTERA